MPISVNSDIFGSRAPAPGPDLALSGPQASALRALMPADPTTPHILWPIYNRAQLAQAAGFTAISGTLTRALNGIRDTNRTSGRPHPGLLARGLVEEYSVDIDGRIEVNYRVTQLGVRAFEAHMASRKVSKPRSKAASVNTRRGYNNPHIGKCPGMAHGFT